MEARRNNPRFVVGLATFLLLFWVESSAWSQFPMMRRNGPHVAQSENFIVFASSPEWAKQVAEAAETQRRELSVYWLGEELPPWPQRCPVHVKSGPNLGASGETRFSLVKHPDNTHPTADNWTMVVAGTQERVLDSVLPHEITHTIFASHFGPLGKYVPRWADEGACTTVEHEAEKSKHREMIQRFLKTGKGLSFNTMFSLKEYPADILPLYAQGHSAVQFLLDQGGPRKFVQFLEAGMSSERWEQALREAYEYKTLGEFQTLWNKWLADGSPVDITAYAPCLQSEEPTTLLAGSSTISRDTAHNREAGPYRDLDRDADAGSSLENVALAASVSGDAVATSHELPLPPAEFMLASQSRTVVTPGLDNDYLGNQDSGNVISGLSRQASAQPDFAPAGSAGRVEQATHTADHASPSEGWYKSRLRKFSSSGSLTTNHNAEVDLTKLRQQSTARPNHPQGPSLQVLDWGSRGPVPGMLMR